MRWLEKKRLQAELNAVEAKLKATTRPEARGKRSLYSRSRQQQLEEKRNLLRARLKLR